MDHKANRAAARAAVSTVCSFAGCGRPRFTLGLCRGHANHHYVHGELRPLLPIRHIPNRDKALAIITGGCLSNAEVGRRAGCSTDQARNLRAKLMREGKIPPQVKPREQDAGGSFKADMEEARGVERCPRCRLTLPHDVCLARDAAEQRERMYGSSNLGDAFGRASE